MRLVPLYGHIISILLSLVFCVPTTVKKSCTQTDQMKGEAKGEWNHMADGKNVRA